MSEDKKRFIYSAIPEETHVALLMLAMKEGVQPARLIEKFIEKGIEGEEDEFFGGEFPPPLKVYRTWLRMRDKQSTMIQLKQIAAFLTLTQDEEEMDNFDTLCKENGMVTQEVLQAAQDETQIYGSSLVMDDNQGVNHATQYLFRKLSDGSEIAVKDLEREATMLGISKTALNAAKRKIGIESRRNSKEWVWLIPLSLRTPSSLVVKGTSL